MIKTLKENEFKHKYLCLLINLNRFKPVLDVKKVFSVESLRICMNLYNVNRAKLYDPWKKVIGY